MKKYIIHSVDIEICICDDYPLDHGDCPVCMEGVE